MPRKRESAAYPLNLDDADDRLRNRFWSKVDKRGPDECWVWTGFRIPGGYGRFNIGPEEGVRGAHRVAYALTKGPLGRNEIPCHTCDNPPCVNPHHLVRGTFRYNTLDCLAKGRKNNPRGERKPNVILTEADVRAIRATPIKRGTAAELAEKYGVSLSTVRDVLARRKWAWLPDEEVEAA